jgi:Kef-type K+ transport system membrane component KefB
MDVSGLPLPVTLLIVFASARLFSEVLERLKQPGIVGEILAGVVIGPALLGWIAPNDVTRTLSELGVIFLLFRVGLDTKASELMKVGGIATAVAISGVIIPLIAGYGIATAWGSPFAEAMFTGAAFVATSVGITAQVLANKGVLRARSSQIILAAAVIDDVLGLIVLAIVSGAVRKQLRFLDLAITALLPIVFTIVVAKWGTSTVGRAAPRIEKRIQHAEAQFHIAMLILFALAAAAIYVGVAAIVGAFLAGMVLSEHTSKRVQTLVHGTSELLVPFFLTGIGLQLSLSVFRQSQTVWLTAVIIVVAALTKVVGCGLAALPLGKRDALRIGVGMIPRGEVGMVVAQLGLSLGVMSQEIYSVVVFAALMTTIITPPLLNIVYRSVKSDLSVEPLPEVA